MTKLTMLRVMVVEEEGKSQNRETQKKLQWWCSGKPANTD